MPCSGADHFYDCDNYACRRHGCQGGPPPKREGSREIVIAAVALGFLALCITAAFAGDWPQRPDPDLTPGASPRDLTIDQVCGTKWGKDERAVTEKMKEQVFAAYFAKYGVRPRLLPDGRAAFEVDHFLSREIAGEDAVENLWPQVYTGPCNAHDKDRLENRLHVEACRAHTIEALHAVQAEVQADWIAAFTRRFGVCGAS